MFMKLKRFDCRTPPQNKKDQSCNWEIKDLSPPHVFSKQRSSVPTVYVPRECRPSRSRPGSTHPLSSEGPGPAEPCGRGCTPPPRSRSCSCSPASCCRCTDTRKGSAAWKRSAHVPSVSAPAAAPPPHTHTHTCARTPLSSCPSDRCAGSRTPWGSRCSCRRSTPERSRGQVRGREDARRPARSPTYLQDSGMDPEVELPVQLHPPPHLDLPAGGEQLTWEVKGQEGWK